MNLNQRIEQWLIQTRDAFHARRVGAVAPSRPFITLCFAQSLDGSLTTRAGETLRLSSAESTRLTHQIRSLHDGILIGIGTVLADDPQLTVREWSGPNPQPIVLDSQLRMPATAKLCRQGGTRCWVLTAQPAPAQSQTPPPAESSLQVPERSSARVAAPPLQAKLACDLLPVAGNAAGQVDLDLAMQLLHQKGIRNLMVEGGAGVITAFLQAGLVDALVLTIAPQIVGGYKAVGELGFSATQQLPQLSPLYSDRIGDDTILWGSVRFAGTQA
jgi:diaminohydroxyphosphoribosylaminopyrimidine deaminase / 5-amino-6-(5-phosphoribosylamino)uracil reductase